MPPLIQKLQNIVTLHQATKVDGMTVDATTAGLVLQIYNNIKPENQKRFLSLGLAGMIDMTFAMLKQKSLQYSSKSTGLKSIEAVAEGTDPADVVNAILEGE